MLVEGASGGDTTEPNSNSTIHNRLRFRITRTWNKINRDGTHKKNTLKQETVNHLLNNGRGIIFESSEWHAQGRGHRSRVAHGALSPAHALQSMTLGDATAARCCGNASIITTPHFEQFDDAYRAMFGPSLLPPNSPSSPK